MASPAASADVQPKGLQLTGSGLADSRAKDLKIPRPRVEGDQGQGFTETRAKGFATPGSRARVVLVPGTLLAKVRARNNPPPTLEPSRQGLNATWLLRWVPDSNPDGPEPSTERDAQLCGKNRSRVKHEESRKRQIQGRLRSASVQLRRRSQGQQWLGGTTGHLSLFIVRLKVAPLPAVHVVLGAVGATAWYSSYKTHVPCDLIQPQPRGLDYAKYPNLAYEQFSNPSQPDDLHRKPHYAQPQLG